MMPIARGEGAWLIGHDGNRYLDAISSWWTYLFGHAHPRIVAALKDQLDRLDHVICAGFTHEPAIELAEALVAIAPRAANEDWRARRVFYADNGSSAVEVALKMSFHYWRNCGRDEQDALHRADRELSRRDARCVVGHRRAALSQDLRAAAARADLRAVARCL